MHIAGLQLPRAGLPENSFKRPAFMIMDIGPDITLGDLKEHFEPTQFIRSGKTNPPNQKVVAYVLEHGIRFEDYKKLENIILRSELFANALVYGAPAYSDLHCDYNYDNFLIREFKDSSWKVDVIDQVDVNTLYVRDVPSPDEESETAMCKFAFYTEFSAFMKKQMPHLDFRHNFQMPESLHPPAYYLSHNTYGIQSDWFMEKRRYFTDRIKQLFSEND